LTLSVSAKVTWTRQGNYSKVILDPDKNGFCLFGYHNHPWLEEWTLLIWGELAFDLCRDTKHRSQNKFLYFYIKKIYMYVFTQDVSSTW
jgi:hypothetical protein